MTYEELKAAYEAAVQKCSELENGIDELKKSNEDQALHIKHLKEQILKRNKMLFGQKSEKSKFICDGQMDLDGNVFNEAEEFSNLSAAEPTEGSITKKSKKTGRIGAEMNCVVTLKQKKSCIHFPKISENVLSAAVCSCRFQKNTSPHGSALSLRKSLRTCPHRVNVRIFRHNFVGGKAKIRRRAVALQGFLTQSPAKFDEKTCMNPYVDRF